MARDEEAEMSNCHQACFRPIEMEVQSGKQENPDDWQVMLFNIVGWQCLALVLTCTSIFSECLSQAHFNAPLFQSLPNYVLLATFFGTPIVCRKKQIHLEWWKYFLLALADVEGNFFVVWAYQKTDIASATLLDCFTIPMVMILSRF